MNTEALITPQMKEAVPVLAEGDIDRYGKTYRILCRQQRNYLLMKGSRVLTFAEFVILQNARKDVDLARARFRSRSA